MDGFMRALVSVWTDSGFAALTWQNMVMILVGLILLYLAIAKQYEPLLLLPIAFGDIMANCIRILSPHLRWGTRWSRSFA